MPNDHQPAHVHVEKAGTVLVIVLDSSPEGLMLREVYDMTLRDQRRATELAREAWPVLVAAWKEIHGE